MVRWVIKEKDEDRIHIWTTGGHEPVGAVCKAEDYWTIDTISLSNGVVVYDPEKVAKLEAEERERERKRRITEYKVEFMHKLSATQHFVKHHVIKLMWIAIGAFIGILAANFVSTFLKGSH